jgi:hypothetical protein
MNKKVLKDGKPRPREKELDWVLEMNLREWMTAKPCLLDPEVQPLLKQLYEFARAVQSSGLGPLLDNLTGGNAVTTSTTHLTELITDRLCQGIYVGGHDIERKSLQETLYFSTGIAPELSPLEFGKRLESFLSLKGSKGLIRVFLGTHLSNLIVEDLRDSLRSAPEVFCGRLQAIERICRKAAATAVHSLNTWSEPGPEGMAALLLDLKAKMTKASTSALRWKRITRSGSGENSSGRVLTATSRFSFAPRAR